MLLEAWERIDDQLVDASAFPSDLSTTPPPALLEWTFTAPISASVSLTDALQLAQSPLLAYPDLPATAPFTATGTWSQTWVAATKPADTTVDQSGNAFAWHDALTTGAVVQLQLNYVNETRQRTESAFLLQGSPDRLIPFFRATSTWNSSNPTEVLIGDQALPGWQVFTESGIWVLFEHDGTLIAFPDSTSLREIIRSMRMVQP